jgi:hypothetical protein
MILKVTDEAGEDSEQAAQAAPAPAIQALTQPPSAEIVATVPTLAMPVRVVSENEESFFITTATAAKIFKVSSPEDFKRGAEYINQLGRNRAYLKKRRLALDKPLRDEVERRQAWIDGEIAKLTAPTEEAERLLNAEMLAYDRMQKEEAAKAEAARRAAAEAVRKAREEAERVEAQRLQIQREAEARREAASKSMDAAQTEEQFEAAGEAFHRGLARDKEAAQIVVPEVPLQALQAPQEIVVPQVFKAKGTKTKRTPVIESVNVKLLPETYLIADEAKIKRHILDGTITEATPGVKFRVEESFVGTGR